MKNKPRNAFLLSILFSIFLFSVAFGQVNLSVRKIGKNFQIKKGAKKIFNIPAQRNDEAFPAGNCVIVRRNVREGELYPFVDRLEIFNLSGKRKIYNERNLGVQRIDDVRVFTNPDKSWSVIMDEEEGVLNGFFLISANCTIKEFGFATDREISWGDTYSGDFINNSTFQLHVLKDKLSENEKKVNIKIRKDGTVKITEE